MLRATTHARILLRLRENEQRLIEMAANPAPRIDPKRIDSALAVLRSRIAQHTELKRQAELAGQPNQDS